MNIITRHGTLKIVNEPTYTFYSSDNGTRHVAEILIASFELKTDFHSRSIIEQYACCGVWRGRWV